MVKYLMYDKKIIHSFSMKLTQTLLKIIKKGTVRRKDKAQFQLDGYFHEINGVKKILF